jgi:hypothetical protein
MNRKAKMFWCPWAAAMGLACGMILVGAFAPTQAGAQVEAKKVAVAKVAKLEVGVPASMAYVDVRALVATSQPSSRPAVVAAQVQPEDVQGTANVVRDAMRTSNWRLVVVAGLLLSVLLLRRLAGFLPARAAAWVHSDRGGATLALATGVLTVVVNGMVAGGKFDPQLLIDGVLASATAAGSFNIAKRLAKPSDRQATPDGQDTPPLR